MDNEMEPHAWCYKCHEPILKPDEIYIWNSYIYHRDHCPPTDTDPESDSGRADWRAEQ